MAIQGNFYFSTVNLQVRKLFRWVWSDGFIPMIYFPVGETMIEFQYFGPIKEKNTYVFMKAYEDSVAEMEYNIQKGWKRDSYNNVEKIPCTVNVKGVGKYDVKLKQKSDFFSNFTLEFDPRTSDPDMQLYLFRGSAKGLRYTGKGDLFDFEDHGSIAQFKKFAALGKSLIKRVKR